MSAIYHYRKKQYTYDEFMNGPGAKMSTAEAYAALDKASGAVHTRRILQMVMKKNGFNLISADADGIKFTGKAGNLSFDSFGDVEKFLMDKKLIKEEKSEAKAEKAQKTKAQRKTASKSAVVKKPVSKNTTKTTKKPEKQDQAAKPAKKKVPEKETVQSNKSNIKKAAKTMKTAKTVKTQLKAVKTASIKKAPVKKNIKESPVAKGKRPNKISERKTTKKAVADTTKKRTGSSVKTVSKNFKNSGFVIRIGRKEYTQERLQGLALDSYKYDMGKDPKKAKVDLYLKADEKKCLFVVNGKDKGELNL